MIFFIVYTVHMFLTYGTPLRKSPSYYYGFSNMVSEFHITNAAMLFYLLQSLYMWALRPPGDQLGAFWVKELIS